MDQEAAIKKPSRLFHVFLAVGILLIGILGLMALTFGKPELEKKKPPVTAPPATYVTVETGPLEIQITGEGTVQALHETALGAQVGGKVVFVSEALANGGRFNKDDVLVRLEKEDYDTALASAQASLKDAQSRYMLTQAESKTAREEWKKLNGGNGSPPALVAKTPQLAAALGGLEAAKANVARAELNLARTEIKAPFDGRSAQKNVDLGQFVNPGQTLAVVFSVEAAEIVIPIADKSLEWLDVPGFTVKDGPGSPATIVADIAGREVSWAGRIDRAQGKVDPASRLVGLVIRVDNPFDTLPPLSPGSYATVNMQGRRLDKAARVPRAALRQGGVVWVVDETDHIRFRPVTVAYLRTEDAVISEGLENGDRVVVSMLKIVSDGMAVKPVSALELNAPAKSGEKSGYGAPATPDKAEGGETGK